MLSLKKFITLSLAAMISTAAAFSAFATEPTPLVGTQAAAATETANDTVYSFYHGNSCVLVSFSQDGTLTRSSYSTTTPIVTDGGAYTTTDWADQAGIAWTTYMFTDSVTGEQKAFYLSFSADGSVTYVDMTGLTMHGRKRSSKTNNGARILDGDVVVGF